MMQCIWTVAGTPLHHDYTNENIELVKKGCCNLERHIKNTLKYGVPVVSPALAPMQI